MKARFSSTMVKAMQMIKKANLSGATLLIRSALMPKPFAPRELRGARVIQRALVPKAKSELRNRVATPKGAENGTRSGERFTWRTYSSEAGHLAYKLYVPSSLKTRKLSLVLMLHGCTQDPDDFATGTQMNLLAEEFGLIVAYPHQPRTANPQGCWNWFDSRHQRRSSGEPAVLTGLAGKLAGEFGIQPGHIFAAGLSAGGAMADVLAETFPDVFAAVGIHSGLPFGAAVNVLAALKVMKGGKAPVRAEGSRATARKIVFHGSADMVVHPSNGEHIFSGVPTRGTQSTIKKTTINGRSITRTLVDDANGRPQAEHWLIEGAGHAWSGARHGGSYTDKTGPDASREMVRFFLYL